MTADRDTLTRLADDVARARRSLVTQTPEKYPRATAAAEEELQRALDAFNAAVVRILEAEALVASVASCRETDRFEARVAALEAERDGAVRAIQMLTTVSEGREARAERAEATVQQLRDVEGFGRDALTILENAHYPPYNQEQSPDAIAVIEGLRVALAGSTATEETT